MQRLEKSTGLIKEREKMLSYFSCQEESFELKQLANFHWFLNIFKSTDQINPILHHGVGGGGAICAWTDLRVLFRLI